jgi:hypothetical protein
VATLDGVDLFSREAQIRLGMDFCEEHDDVQLDVLSGAVVYRPVFRGHRDAEVADAARSTDTVG